MMKNMHICDKIKYEKYDFCQKAFELNKKIKAFTYMSIDEETYKEMKVCLREASDDYKECS